MHDPISGGERIAVRLRTARELAGLTQAQVAKVLELHRPSVSEMEAGRRKVSAQELAKLAELYDVDLAWLAGEEGDRSTAVDDRVKLAAREFSKLRDEDLDRILDLIRALRASEASE